MIEVRGLAVAEGDGRLVRRDGGILFLPAWGDGAEVVLDAFRSAASDEIIDAVPTSVVDGEFAVPPFACVTWSPRITLLVFGDLEIRTDHPALPMLSAAASQTWVEHTLRGVTEHVVVTVDPPTEGAPSDLEAGVVPSGGFALELATVDDGSATDDDAGTEPVERAAPDQVSSPVPPTGDGSDLGETAGPATSAASAPSTGAVPSEGAAGPGDAAAGSDGAVGSGEGVVGSGAAGSTPEDTPGGGRDAPTAPGAPDQGPSGEVGNGQPLVQAVRCEAGHLTAAGSTACRVCGQRLSPGAPASTVPRPSLGVLRLDDGRMLELDRSYRIGRKPGSDDRVTAARLEGEKVSREHVEVLLREWDVLVRDCNSTNGTWIASNAQARFRRVEPEVPVRIEPGTVIRIDRRTMTFIVQDD